MSPSGITTGNGSGAKRTPPGAAEQIAHAIDANDLPEQAPVATVLGALNAPRIVIENITPAVDGGSYPAKGIAGQALTIAATIYIDGHDQLAAQVLVRAAPYKDDGAYTNDEAHKDGGSYGSERGDEPVLTLPLRARGNDRWTALFAPTRPGDYRFIVEAWLDTWATHSDALRKKRAAGVAIALEIEECEQLLRDAVARGGHTEAARQAALLAKQVGGADIASACELLLADSTTELMRVLGERRFVTRSQPLSLDVERGRAGFASWYELFPRSQTRSAAAHGTFDDVIARLPAIQAMGFDVLYFPPIHPIGQSHRKGRNNSLTAAADDPGSPYAIGAADGGHEAVHAELGGIAAFRRLRNAAQAYDIELALDFAIQCSPDHPWLREHPEWFAHRADGSIRHAENPPKKYEDIVNVDFYAPGAQPALWLEWRDVLLYWIGEGVKIFRVDNPHTKPLPFWQWLIADIRAQHPDVIFLAEAFTRPAMMYRLAKIGFTQSYTYFTWRNDRQELTDYLTELADGPARDFYRPHFFVNTPDINPYFLQTSGRAGFMIRAALAATLSGLWGMYSGFELCEGAALPGKEEYLDSEKYEIRPRDWSAPGNIIAVITRLNHLRREHPALQTQLGIRFHEAGNDNVIYFSKCTPDGASNLLVAISLDPHAGQEAWLQTPALEYAAHPGGVFEVEELMRGIRMSWQGQRQHWYFDPGEMPFAIWRLPARAEEAA